MTEEYSREFDPDKVLWDLRDKGAPVVIVTSEGPQSGKTTAAEYIAERLELLYGRGSKVIEGWVEVEQGLALGTIEEARKQDPHAYRAALIEAANQRREWGVFPTTDQLHSSYSVVDGARTLSEAEASKRWADSWGRPFVHVHLVGRKDGGDNTEADALRDHATYIVENDGTLPMLFKKLDWVCARAKVGDL